MKRIIPVFLALSLLLGSFSAAFAHDGTGALSQETVSLVSEDTEKLYVVIPENETAHESFAAKLLAGKLQMIFGIDAGLAADSEKISGNIIAVGNTVYNKEDMSQMDADSYVIAAFSHGVSIAGSGNRGLIDGVYRFLSDFCGYEVYTKDVIGYTDEKKLAVPADLLISCTPFFEYRRLDTKSAEDPEYALAHSLNSIVGFPAYQGGIVEYYGPMAHSLVNFYCSPDKYFDSHPEYYALRDGRRVPDQLCLTNPEVLEIVTREVLELLAEEYDPDAALQIVSLTQADNQNYCTCPSCKALDRKNGSHAGSMISFVNAVADAVKEAGYDNAAVDTFAYQYTRECPTNVVPRDNVIVRICSIECCFGHTLDDKRCPENVGFMKDLKKWGDICDNIYIWDYANNYSETFLPFADFGVLQRNMQIFYENGVRGEYTEGNYYMDSCNGEFYELRTYLLSKLMQDPYRDDYDELMTDYLVNVYGPGGVWLKKFIELTEKRSVTLLRHLHITQQPDECLPGLRLSEVKQADEWWRLAKEMAETEKQLKEIERSEICWQYFKCCRYLGEYSLLNGLADRLNAKKALADKLTAFGNSKVGEYGTKYLRVDNPLVVYFLPPTCWESKYDDSILRAANYFEELIRGHFGGAEYPFRVSFR